MTTTPLVRARHQIIHEPPKGDGVTSMPIAMPLASDMAEIDSWPTAIVYLAAIAAICFMMWLFFRD